MPETHIGIFLHSLEQGLQDGHFVRLSLAAYRGQEPGLVRIYIRKILIRHQEKISFTFQYKTRDIVKNHTLPESLALIRGYLEKDFHTAALFTTQFDMHFQQSRAGKTSLRKTRASHAEPPPFGHDHLKKRFIVPEGKPYLHALGITDESGKVFKNAQDKYRQINKYIEILDGLIQSLPPQELRHIADMGAGKGYLTFALCDYLSNTLKLRPQITGIDTRADMVKLCNEIAKQSGFENLRFVQNAIEAYDASGTDILIALHACDIATDEAIYKGIMAGSRLIVVAPCCHKQIRLQIDAKKIRNDLAFLTRHGIFAGRQAEMVTDGIRALILEYYGYDTKIFEFISDAHTPKNIMIVGKKSDRAPRLDAAIADKIEAAKAYFGIEYHHLERLLSKA